MFFGLILSTKDINLLRIHYPPAVLAVTSVLSISLLFVSALLISLLPLADNMGIVKLMKSMRYSGRLSWQCYRKLKNIFGSIFL